MRKEDRQKSLVSWNTSEKRVPRNRERLAASNVWSWVAKRTIGMEHWV